MPDSVVVVVTEPEYHKARAVFEASRLPAVAAPPAEEALAAAVRAHGARHAVVGVARYAGPLYEALPGGGVLARFGVGHDGIDKARATAAGILCTNTPGVLTGCVAETTMMLVLAAARRFDMLAGAVRAGRWTTPPGSELAGKKLAVIGCGPIGLAVARIASRGFGMAVTGNDVRRVSEAEARESGLAAVTADFGEAVRDADFVTLHIPALPETRHFLGSGRLALLPAKAWLINTARGSVVDEAALYDALAARRLAGAALDVFEREPYEPADPARDLRLLENAILTPHIGSNTAEANRRMAERALRNIELAEAGAFGEMDLLNPAVLR